MEKPFIKNVHVITLYELLCNEFIMLQKSTYPKSKVDGYEDALWDIKIIAKERFSIDLPKVEKESEKNDNMICNCGHVHKDHLPTSSINYTAGRCAKCTCKNFIINNLK